VASTGEAGGGAQARKVEDYICCRMSIEKKDGMIKRLDHRMRRRQKSTRAHERESGEVGGWAGEQE